MRWLTAFFLFCVALAGPHLELRRDTGEGLPAGVLSLGVSSLDFPGAAASPAAGDKRASAAARRAPGPFRVEVLAVLDGDTVEVRFMDGPCGRLPCIGQEASIRIVNIDAPEAHACRSRSRSRSGGASCAACPAEHALGQQALAFTRDLVVGQATRTLNVRPDKFHGRVVAELQVLKGGTWLSVGGALIKAGLAVPYDGRAKRKPWCRRKTG
jgi:endonuclease YncB( thermonuclease family)